ncbi:hypothetical protein WJX72_005050 [[Myrmecia] bisecta]|uniref:AD domain-containing protein n=1 Tax=[Myrmecia] bisecta TaxID=41462 RepID=A0AAW1QRA4_9CHLO
MEPEGAGPVVASEWVVGCEVALQTTLGEDLEGQVFAYDKNTNCCILLQPGSTPFHNHLRILKANYIKTVVTAKRANQQPDLHLPVVDMQRCRDREERALQAALQEAAKIGVGVTKEAQTLFNALSKTMPTRWNNTTIVVLDEVSISEPYRLENCTTKHPEDKSTLQRVRKVLEAERKRLGHD